MYQLHNIPILCRLWTIIVLYNINYIRYWERKVQRFWATAGGTLHVPPAVAVVWRIKNLYLLQNFAVFTTDVVGLKRRLREVGYNRVNLRESDVEFLSVFYEHGIYCCWWMRILFEKGYTLMTPLRPAEHVYLNACVLHFGRRQRYENVYRLALHIFNREIHRKFIRLRVKSENFHLVMRASLEKVKS